MSAPNDCSTDLSGLRREQIRSHLVQMCLASGDGSYIHHNATEVIDAILAVIGGVAQAGTDRGDYDHGYADGVEWATTATPTQPLPAGDKGEAADGARISNWLADYSHDLMEEGDFDQEAAKLAEAAQWIADRISGAAYAPQTPVVATAITGIRAAEIVAEYIELCDGLKPSDAANIIHILHRGGVRFALPSTPRATPSGFDVGSYIDNNGDDGR